MADLDRFCAFAERFLTDERGRPLVIEGFQREVPADYFGGAGWDRGIFASVRARKTAKWLA